MEIAVPDVTDGVTDVTDVTADVVVVEEDDDHQLARYPIGFNLDVEAVLTGVRCS